MSSLNAVNKLLKKSSMFLKSAEANLKRGLYDIVCFEADQAVQLFIKANVLKLSGFMPKTEEKVIVSIPQTPFFSVSGLIESFYFLKNEPIRPTPLPFLR